MMSTSERLWLNIGLLNMERINMIKYVYEAILNQTLNHNGSGHDVREATSENQKQLLNDGFESNMTKKGT